MKAGRQRLDRWLWYARFAKSRSLAARLVEEGHIRVNGIRTESAAKSVVVGDVVTIAAARTTQVVRVARLGERRGPAPEARGLYDEIALPTAAFDPSEGSQE